MERNTVETKHHPRYVEWEFVHGYLNQRFFFLETDIAFCSKLGTENKKRTSKVKKHAYM